MDYNEEFDYEVQVYRPNLKDRADPINHFSDTKFRDRFRMHKQSVIILSDAVVIPIPQSQRGNPIPKVLQVLVTLRFYAVGAFIRETGDFFQHQSFVCKPNYSPRDVSNLQNAS